ncbi:hypothetical protein KC19_10G150600 [Ceratodon purpureus]|uniref:Uncharacterized protein n=1 Tax=Ceratodon purpureus TaxID=3225 RepID=A0A8T0GP53_CERPU|nr:hypothetical protein KC19_10G150600 [Ceratodon purpureus]
MPRRASIMTWIIHMPMKYPCTTSDRLAAATLRKSNPTPIMVVPKLKLPSISLQPQLRRMHIDRAFKSVYAATVANSEERSKVRARVGET